MQVHRNVMKSLAAAVALTLVISLVCGCTRESKDFASLQEENRALKRELARIEGQSGAAVTPRPDMNEELLVLARELRVSPIGFAGKQIKLHCRFGGFENKFLGETKGPDFPSTYYTGLIVQNGKGIEEPIFTHLFISKKEAKEQGVYRLGRSDLITVYGMVRSGYKNEPWIEAYGVKQGWE
jgi:hypothetical protein